MRNVTIFLCRHSIGKFLRKAVDKKINNLFYCTNYSFPQLMEKDENLMKYEEQLKAMKDSTLILQEALKKQRSAGSWSSETAMLEEEWMRRFNETREMYEEAIQGYKDQLEQTQRKVVMDEQDYAQQIEELGKQLKEAHAQLKAKEIRLDEAKVNDKEDHARG